MGHAVGDGDVSTHRHAAAATVPGTYGHGLSGPGTTRTARAELGMSCMQPHHHHGTVRPRPAVHLSANAVSDSGPSPMTATAANTFAILQQQPQQDSMNASHLSFHIQSNYSYFVYCFIVDDRTKTGSRTAAAAAAATTTTTTIYVV